MKKTHKAVLKSSLIMLSLLALVVVSSGVAQAQECFARRVSGSDNTVRAEGMTEPLGGIELKCAGGMGTGFDPPATIEVSIELNTMITNATKDDDGDMVMGLTYTNTDGDVLDMDEANLGEASDWNMGFGDNDVQALSDDGMGITWAIPSSALTLDTRTSGGGTVVIGGILADASAVGNGEDITVTVIVAGVEASGSPVKLADVTTGLVIEVSAATGLQCDKSAVTATVMFTEGFNSAIRAVPDDPETTGDGQDESDIYSLVLNFRGIPDGVTVTASMEGTGEALEDDMSDLAPLMLVTGEDEGADKDGIVELSSVGAGEARYKFDTGNLVEPVAAGNDPAVLAIPEVDDGTKEWNNVKITFSWGAGEPPLDMGTVTVSYHPVDDGTGDIPRYVSGPTNNVLTIDDCTTTLLFPFVTNQMGFNTGLVITNASEGSGDCTLGYSGADAPDDMMTPRPIAGGEQWVDLLSEIADGFQGYITASCEFRDAHGFAFITGPGDDLAQGYLALCTNCD